MVARAADPAGDGGSTWVAIEGAGELRGDGPHAVSARGVDLVLLRGRGGLRAYEGRCPHQGALLGEGEIEGSTLVCRNHRWRFDIETGKRQGGDQCLRACPVREESGAVLVDMTRLSWQFLVGDLARGPARDVAPADAAPAASPARPEGSPRDRADCPSWAMPSSSRRGETTSTWRTGRASTDRCTRFASVR